MTTKARPTVYAFMDEGGDAGGNFVSRVPFESLS